MLRIIVASCIASLTAFALPARADRVEDVAADSCTLDDALVSTAQLALHDHDPLDGDALRDSAEDSGVVAPSVRAWVGRGDEEGVARAARTWLAHQGIVAAWARCAVVHRADLYALVLVPRVAHVEGERADVSLGAHVSYGVALPPGARAARIVVAQPDGTVSRGHDDVRFDEAGEYTLQVLAETDQGPLPFALWHVTVGGDARPGPAAVTANDTFHLLSAINTERARANAPPLRSDPLLVELAQSRARELAARGVVAHGLAPSDSPVVRLREAHVGVDRVAENVARAATLDEANTRLDASPSHRANRIDPALDAVGIGVVTLGDAVYVVELYAARPRIVGGL